MERDHHLDRATRRQLARWLAGELGAEEERRLRQRLAEEPALAREAEGLRRTWDALEEPAGVREAVPPGFSGRVLARVREEAETPRLSWSAAPGWARAASAAALVAGLFLGAGLGGGMAPAPLGGRAAGSSPPAPRAPVAEAPAPVAEAAATTAEGSGEGRTAAGVAPQVGSEPAAVAPGGDDGQGGGGGAGTAAAADPATRVAEAPAVSDDAWQDLYYGDLYGGGGGNYGGNYDDAGGGDGFGSLGATYAAALSSLGEEDT